MMERDRCLFLALLHSSRSERGSLRTYKIVDRGRDELFPGHTELRCFFRKRLDFAREMWPLSRCRSLPLRRQRLRIAWITYPCSDAGGVIDHLDDAASVQVAFVAQQQDKKMQFEKLSSKVIECATGTMEENNGMRNENLLPSSGNPEKAADSLMENLVRVTPHHVWQTGAFLIIGHVNNGKNY